MIKINLNGIKFIPKKAIPWIIWSIPGLFYFYDVVLRIFPSTISQQFMDAFSINATQFGFYTASYYVTYTLMQIPAGIIVDRISVYKTLFIACCCCLFGLLITHYCHNIQTATIGRLIIGFGAAFAYVATLKIASIWLAASNFGIAAAIADSLGMLGGIFTDQVLTKMNVSEGFEFSEAWLIATGVVIVLLILFVLRDRPRSKRQKVLPTNNIVVDKLSIYKRLLNVIKSKQIWLIGIVGCLYYLPSSVVGDVWGIPFLKTVYHFTEQQAANGISFFFAGWVIFGPIIGWLSDHHRLRIRPITWSIVAIFIMFVILIYGPHAGLTLGVKTIYSMFFLIGILTSAHPLIFALAKENFPLRSTGTVIATVNTLVMLGGMLFQPLTGYLLDVAHGSVGATVAQVYTAQDYALAMSILPVSLIIAWISMQFVHDTGKEIEKQEVERNTDNEEAESGVTATS